MNETAAVPAVKTRQVVAFTLDTEDYAVPIGQVKEVVEIQELTLVPGTQDFLLGIMNLRGKIVPVISLEDLFGLERQTPRNPAHTIVAEDAEAGAYGIQVDRVSEVLVVPESSVKPAPQMLHSKISAEYVEGVILLPGPEGETDKAPEKVTLLLDLRKIITVKVSEQLSQILQDPRNSAANVTHQEREDG
jgi:purine-binding chemotaxis protein CheW